MHIVVASRFCITFVLRVALNFRPIIPELDIAVRTQCSSLDQLTLLLHDILKRNALVGEYLTMSVC
jgi:hypothetical protein